MALLALGGVVCIWGMGPVMSKLITGPPLTIAFGRFFIATPVALGVCYATGRRLSWRVLRASFWGGVLFGLNLVLFFSALKHTSIATVSLIGILQPVIVQLGAWKMFGERPTRFTATWTSVALAAIGVAMLTAGKDVRATGLGLVLSVGMTAAFSAYILATRTARKAVDSWEYLAGVMIWAALVTALPAVVQGTNFSQLDGRDWFWIAVVVIGPGVIGHVLLNWAIPELPMAITSLQMLPATVISIGASWPIHDEHITLPQGLAAVVAMVSVGLVVWRQQQRR